MLITTSNVLLNVTPIVVTGASSDNEISIVDPDFSTNYTSSNAVSLIVEFGSTIVINYVAIAGVNIEGNRNFTSFARVFDGSTLIATTFISRNHCIVIDFPEQTFANLRVEILNVKGDKNPQVHFIAAGQGFIIPNNGENAGYNRQFLNRNIKNKTTTNANAAPTALLRKNITAKGSLKLPNMTKIFSETTWQTFLDFAYENFFFIREQDFDITGTLPLSSNNDSAYMCYEPTSNKITAHAQTRSLNNINISFKVFNGL